MQEDCLSAVHVLFIYYLGKALNGTTIQIAAQEDGLLYIEPKFADVITSVTINDTNNKVMNESGRQPTSWESKEISSAVQPNQDSGSCGTSKNNQEASHTNK